MNAALERKYFSLKALDIENTGKKRVKVAIAELESIDRDQDVFAPTAFDKTIKERGPKGSQEIWHMTDHGWSIKSALSKYDELYREGKYIVGIAPYRDTKLWRDTVWALYEAGDINQHSVGFATLKSENGTNHRIITEASLWEGSAVLWGANPNTPTQAVMKSMTPVQRAENLSKRFDYLISQIKSGRFEDDTSLLQLELKNLQQTMIDLSQGSTEPASKATQPDSVQELLPVLQNTIKELLTT